MAGQARGKVTVDVEECKGCGLCVESCPPKCLRTNAGVESLRSSSGTLHGTRLHRMRNLFLLLPGTGRDYGLPDKARRKSIRGGARRPTCGSSVKEM